MISVVIPNFNGGKLLARNLPKLLALLEKSRLDYEIVVVDDASTDDSVAILTSFASSHLAKLSIRLLQRPKNEGFASTVDAGIRAARGEIFFTLKTDAVPEKSDYFKLMKAHFEDDRTFAVSAALETVEKGPPSFADGELWKGKQRIKIRGQGVLIFFRGFFLHFRTYEDYVEWFDTMRTTRLMKKIGLLPSKMSPPDPRYSFWSDGGASAFRRDLYLKIGGFDKLYNPFYWEDTDLGYRAWKAGYQVDFEPRAVLVHNFESGTIAKHYTKKQVKIISQRNQFIFVWKNSDLKHLLLYFLWETYHATVALKNRDWDFFRAYWLAVLKWPGILAARWRQRKVTRLSDDEALRGLRGESR